MATPPQLGLQPAASPSSSSPTTVDTIITVAAPQALHNSPLTLQMATPAQLDLRPRPRLL